MGIPYAEKVTFGEGVSRAWKYWNTAEGTASRSEFWSWVGFIAVINISLNVLQAINLESGNGLYILLFSIVTLAWVLTIATPTVAIFIRRGRDIESLLLAGLAIVLFGASQLISFAILMQFLLSPSIDESALETLSGWSIASQIIFFVGVLFTIMLGLFDGVAAPPNNSSSGSPQGTIDKVKNLRKTENDSPALGQTAKSEPSPKLDLATLLPLMKIVYEGENPNNNWEKLLEAYLAECYTGTLGSSEVVPTLNRLSIIAQKLNDIQPPNNSLPYQSF